MEFYHKVKIQLTVNPLTFENVKRQDKGLHFHHRILAIGCLDLICTPKCDLEGERLVLSSISLISCSHISQRVGLGC